MTDWHAPGLSRRNRLLRKYWPFYLMALVPLAQVILINYIPIYGVVIAFKDFRITRGISGSAWVGLKHFRAVFNDAFFYRALWNTLRISFVQLITHFTLTIVFALLINEIQHVRFKRTVQTVSYLPYFLSWVVVGAFVHQILSPNGGALNIILVNLGVLEKPRYFMIERQSFLTIFVVANLWKTIGYAVIIYLAAIAGINQELYESAHLDGANRFKRVLHITLPGLAPTISTLLILNVGGLLSIGFDPIFNLYNASTEPVADVISTYVYRRGLIDMKYDFTTAIGLFQNVVAFSLVLTTNFLAKKTNPDFRIL